MLTFIYYVCLLRTVIQVYNLCQSILATDGKELFPTLDEILAGYFVMDSR